MTGLYEHPRSEREGNIVGVELNTVLYKVVGNSMYSDR